MSEPKSTTEMSIGSSIELCPKCDKITSPIPCALCETLECDCPYTAEDYERMCERACFCWRQPQKQSRIK